MFAGIFIPCQSTTVSGVRLAKRVDVFFVSRRELACVFGLFDGIYLHTDIFIYSI